MCTYKSHKKEPDLTFLHNITSFSGPYIISQTVSAPHLNTMRSILCTIIVVLLCLERTPQAVGRCPLEAYSATAPQTDAVCP